ncbi:hypothetical protein VNO78_21060 [Psophocarpus tetragonolobus]|uniref:Uncharacterized protein n=1 Tax=Psophocarpus tetragonolobus TaxID=3891 RepID=A0AAN9XHT7_PSOTE
MGNCLVLQENMVRIMKSDGKILEYNTPIKVHHVLNQFSNHAISDSLPILHHLHPNTKLLKGHLYHLVPLPQPSPKVCNKRLMFHESDHQVQDKGDVVRIKLVLSKQELKDMLQKGGISVNDVLSLVQVQKGIDVSTKYNDASQSHGWKPALQTIPE